MVDENPSRKVEGMEWMEGDRCSRGIRNECVLPQVAASEAAAPLAKNGREWGGGALMREMVGASWGGDVIKKRVVGRVEEEDDAFLSSIRPRNIFFCTDNSSLCAILATRMGRGGGWGEGTH